MEWRSVVFIEESRFCLYVSDGYVHVQRKPGKHHLPECICLRRTGPISGFMVWGAISYNSWSHLVFLQGKVNSVRNIAQAVNPVLLPFIQQEGGVLFQQDDTYPHMAAATQHALHGVQQLSWPARPPYLLPIEHVWDMMKQELTLSPEAATMIAEL